MRPSHWPNLVTQRTARHYSMSINEDNHFIFQAKDLH